jgi:dTDP-4-amino-4,6-dideoxygalactose transaminase
MPSNRRPSAPACAADIENVPLLDIQRENGPLQAELQTALNDVLQSGWFVLGPHCQGLEEEVAQLCGAKHAIGCASGSDALLLALMALDIGVDDEVILPSFTFFATASASWRLGAKPVFVDIDPASFNLDPAAVEAAITPATKAIIPVHLFGQCAEMDALQTLADKHKVTIVEDAAQAIGARYQDRGAGSMGAIGCFSFYPTKNLGGCGDGGMLTTNDDGLADQLRRLRNHGMEPRYYHHEVGVNSRLDAFQAAALRVKLKHLSDWSEARRDNAARYHDLFQAAGMDSEMTLPAEGAGQFHVWNQFTIRVTGGQRDALRAHLQQAKIGSEIYYPIPLHQQKCFAGIVADVIGLSETDKAAAEVLSLPIFPHMTAAEQAYVVQHVAEFFAHEAKSAA